MKPKQKKLMLKLKKLPLVKQLPKHCTTMLILKIKNAKYEASNTTVQKLAKDFSGYKYYSAKGLVLMAKNFYALKDAFQATYILESVIQNFTEFDDVVTEAKAELSKIKAEEAKTNSSIQAGGN